jgi:hypothetical protein
LRPSGRWAQLIRTTGFTRWRRHRVGHDPLDGDAVGREPGDCSLEEPDAGLAAFVAEDFHVGEAAVVIDRDVYVVPAGTGDTGITPGSLPAVIGAEGKGATMGTFGSRRLRGAVVITICAVVAASCSSGDDTGAEGEGDGAAPSEAVELPDAYEGYESELYADGANWLCRPDITDDVCHRDLDATVVQADGATEVVPHEPAADPPVDCFYVYPTTSADPGPNSDLEPAESEEIATVYNQAARLTASCRVFAPIYRQGTLSSIGGGAAQGGGDDPWNVAYQDVVDAFRYYVAQQSDGRGFVLIGHSQGSGLLNRLIQEEIEAEPLLRDRLVSGMLLGWSVAVPEGEVAGGDFAEIPLCESGDQTGCIVTYESFRSTAPPPPASIFGRSSGEGSQAGCTNPAALGGGSAPLQPYFVVDQVDGTLLGGQDAVPFADPARTAEITTPFVTYPDLVTAECVHEGDFTYLALTVGGDPADPRTDDIRGDLTPEWGMHLIDVNVAMGDLVALVASQAAAYAG